MQTLHATNRDPAVAGTFYSSHKEELSAQLAQLFKDAKEFSKEKVRAIIVPHAGYVYSAPTAVQAYKTLNRSYKNVFLIGSSHHINIDGASIYALGDYTTPLGVVKVNQQIVKELLQHTKLFSYEKEAHTKEHTLEVQLPFLQTLYKEELQIVPIIIATSNPETIEAIARILKPYFNDENLFVISTDLSHFPSYEDANNVDHKTLHAMASNDISTFIQNIQANSAMNMNELYTSACGWSSVLNLLHLTKGQNLQYEILDYKNSGDTKYGDKNRVVGYGALRVYEAGDDSFFTKEEERELLALAKNSLEKITLTGERFSPDTKSISAKLREPLGAFVTLYKNGKLRGCIGRFEPREALYEIIIDMAIAAAQEDPRFNKVIPEELKDIKLEISVLSPRKRISSIDEVIVGKHGIYVEHGYKHGTYLPHVATQMNWSAKEFVEHCALEKAGISFKDLDKITLYTYEAIIIKEE